MEYIIFFLALGAFFLLLFVHEAVLSKKEEKRFIQSLYQNYGKIPEKEYSLERYVRIASYYQKHKSESLIDDITWNDLDMDDVFKRMNDTYSASGEEYLYYTLRNTNKSEEELAHLEDMVQYFREHADERVQIQYIMRQLGYTGKYSLYDYIDNLDYLGERSSRRHILLNCLFLPLLALLPFQMSIALMGLTVLVIYNILSYFKEKKEIEPYILSFAYILRLAVVSEKLLKLNVPVCSKEWESIREAKEGLHNMRRGSFWVFTNRGSASGNPLDVILDYIKMIFHVDLIQFNKMLSQLRMHIADVDALITLIGQVETAIAVGAFRESLECYCVPGFTEGGELSVREAYHPLIVNPVKNSISTKKGVLLTGSNASGKSTFLKTIALNAIFAQTIHTCTAESYSGPLFQIYSSMSLRDSIEKGESYYIVEIKALKRILDASKGAERRILCFVDEVLRGTNTVERIAASTQILKSLADTSFLCFAATHDIEMTELLKQDYVNYHFEEDIREGDVFFNYKLLPGKATTRNAIKLLQIMGYDEKIIEKATRQAEHFVASGVWEAI